MNIWNPWHGCKKYSEGCQNCYVYRRDSSVGRDASEVVKTSSFNEPIKLNKEKKYKISSGTEVYACMTSDFFIEEADNWRNDAWQIIDKRKDVHFNIITKRIVRAKDCLPENWDGGYENVTIGCTAENQKQADIRLPIFKNFPAKHKFIICEPLLEDIDMSKYLGAWVSHISVGGESGPNARVCDYDWVLSIRSQCIDANVSFIFRQTGANFIKDGRLYKIPRYMQQSQATSAKIDKF